MTASTPSPSRSKDAPRAPFVCESCRARKKACDKKLPICTHCKRRDLPCRYSSPPPSAQRLVDFSKITPTKQPNVLLAKPHTASPTPSLLTTSTAELRTSIQAQVSQVLPSTHRFTDDLGAQFFRGPHCWLPFLSRDAFYRNFFDYSRNAEPDFGLFLLTMSLLTRARGSLDDGVVSDRNALYLTVKTSFVQLQVLMEPTQHLVCAGILLSLFEYTVQRSCDALATLSMTARLAYVVDLHLEPIRDDLESKCANNIWWALVICERIFVSEAHPPTQGLITPWPPESRPLPTDLGLSTPNFPCSQIPSKLQPTPRHEHDSFSRAAQEVSLLDQLLTILRSAPSLTQLAALSSLDADLQSFFSAVMQQAHGALGTFCPAIALAIRTLFILHNHILAHVGTAWSRGAEPPSRAAMDTATRIIVDVAHIHAQPGAAGVDALHPCSVFAMRDAIAHLSARGGEKDMELKRAPEKLLAQLTPH